MGKAMSDTERGVTVAAMCCVAVPPRRSVSSGFQFDLASVNLVPRHLATPRRTSTSTSARHAAHSASWSFLLLVQLRSAVWPTMNAVLELISQIQFQTEPDVYNRFLDVMKEFKGQM